MEAQDYHDALARIEALDGAAQVIDALRLALGALEYVAADATTLLAAKTTASGAIFGIQKAIAAPSPEAGE